MYNCTSVSLLVLSCFLISTALCDYVWNSLSDCQEKFVEKTASNCPGFAAYPALKHEFPHAAAIGWTQNGSQAVKWACGGSLISENTILTAAHCTFGPNGIPPDVVRLGDLNLITDDDKNDTQQFEVQTIVRHPSYKPRYNDVALIKLNRNVAITKYVMPACLWSKKEIPNDIIMEACGFGQTEYGGDISPILNKVIVTPVNTTECQEHYTNDRLLRTGLFDEIHLCADDKTGRRMDTCEGDSGGPLEVKWEYVLGVQRHVIPFIIGVTAFGIGCGGYSPGVYTRVSPFIDWIKTNVPELAIDSTELSSILNYVSANSTISPHTELIR